MRSIQRTITSLLLTTIVLVGAALLGGTMAQIEQFQQDLGEIQHVTHGISSAWDEEMP